MFTFLERYPFCSSCKHTGCSTFFVRDHVFGAAFSMCECDPIQSLFFLFGIDPINPKIFFLFLPSKFLLAPIMTEDILTKACPWPMLAGFVIYGPQFDLWSQRLKRLSLSVGFFLIFFTNYSFSIFQKFRVPDHVPDRRTPDVYTAIQCTFKFRAAATAVYTNPVRRPA